MHAPDVTLHVALGPQSVEDVHAHWFDVHVLPGEHCDGPVQAPLHPLSTESHSEGAQNVDG
jgi:hypothetical protein